MSKVDGVWIRGRMADMQITQVEMAKALGLKYPSYLNKRLNGGAATFTATEIGQMADILEVPFDEMAVRCGVPVPSVTADDPKAIKVAFIADRKGRVRPWSRKLPSRKVRPLGDVGALTSALMVEDAGSPFDRAIALYTPTKRVDPHAVGRLALVDTGEEILFGVLQPGTDKGSWSVRRIGDGTESQHRAVRSATPIGALLL